MNEGVVESKRWCHAMFTFMPTAIHSISPPGPSEEYLWIFLTYSCVRLFLRLFLSYMLIKHSLHITQEQTQEYLRYKLRVNSRKISWLIPQMGQVGGLYATFYEFFGGINPYSVRIVKSVQIIGPSLNVIAFCCTQQDEVHSGGWSCCELSEQYFIMNRSRIKGNFGS